MPLTTEQVGSLYDAGVLTVPCIGKTPLVPYQHWRDALPLRQTVVEAWENKRPDCVAVLAGIDMLGLGGIAVVDVDEKNDPGIAEDFMDEFRQSMPDLFADCCIQTTPSGGLHIMWRSMSTLRSIALATREVPGKKTPIPTIELLAANRLCHIAPGQGYKKIHGSVSDLKTLSVHDEGRIVRLAESFTKTTFLVPSEMPGKAYNDAATTDTVIELLEIAGWKTLRRNNRGATLNRPGARNKDGVDASVRDKALFVWTSSDSVFEPSKSYSPFAVYACLKHGGNYKEAAKALRDEGFGADETYIETRVGQGSLAHDEGPPDPFLEMMMSRRFSLTQKVDFDFNFWRIDRSQMKFPHESPIETGIGGPGMLIAFVGKQKSRKTTVMTSVAAAALSGKEVCGWKLQNPGKVAWFDCEQSEYFYDATQRKIYAQAKMSEDDPRYAAFTLRKYSDPALRLALIKRYAEETPDLKVLFVDGIVDLMSDFNSNKESIALINDLMALADRGASLFLVLHLNKHDGTLRGSIGTEVQNKFDAVIECTRAEDDDCASDVVQRDGRAKLFKAFRVRVDSSNTPMDDHAPDQRTAPPLSENYFSAARKNFDDEQLF